MKCIPYITTACLLLSPFFLTSCFKDPETKNMEKSIAILEDVTDEDSADSAAGKLMDIQIGERQYTRDNINVIGKYQKLIKEAAKKNYYNSETLKAALSRQN